MNIKVPIRKFFHIPKFLFKKSGLESLINNKKNQKKMIKVPINKLRCQEKPFSLIQGFYGKNIEYFPPYQFFSQSLTDTNQAIDNFKNWLKYSLIDLEGWKISKAEGGYAGGSLYRYIFHLHRIHGYPIINFDQVQTRFIEEAVTYRANYYLELLNFIKKNHNRRHFHMPIYCYPENSKGNYIIVDGHHRASAYKVLGVENIEAIIVNQGENYETSLD